jgi:transposase-like protein
MTVAAFCRREGVSPANFYRWRKRLTSGASSGEQTTTHGAVATRGRTTTPHSGQSAFVELALAPATIVEIELPNGVRVRVPADRERALQAAIRAAGEVASQTISTIAREASSC